MAECLQSTIPSAFCNCVLQEIQQLMVAEKIDTDAVGHMFGIEAAMEAWDKAGRPNDMLTQANDMWHRSPIVDMKPIFKSHDSRSATELPSVPLADFPHCQLCVWQV